MAYADGGEVALQRRERPHLVFDERGYITHLTSGAQPPPDPAADRPPKGFLNDYTYTLIVPVEPQPRAVVEAA